MSKVLLTTIGCRYTCAFCHPQRPYEAPEFSHAKNRQTLFAEIDSAPSTCAVFVIGGADCVEDLDLLFELSSYIRMRRGGEPQIHVQSHCAAFRHPELVDLAIAHGVNRILVPIYGPTSEIHHSVMRPKPGTSIDGFPQLEAIENCLACARMGVTAHTVLAETTVDHLTEIIDTLHILAGKYHASIDYRIRPVLLTEGGTEHYMPVKELSPYLNQAHEHLLRLSEQGATLDYHFEGFPLCLFRHQEPRLMNSDFPAKLREQYALFMGGQVLSTGRNASDVPNHRIRVHAPMCRTCLLNERCAGFQQVDYETYGTGSLQPIG